MKNLSSDKLVRLIIAIACIVIGLAGVLFPYFFKEQMGNFWNYFLTILGAVFIFVSLLIAISSLSMFSIEFHTWVVRDTDFTLFCNHKSGSKIF